MKIEDIIALAGAGFSKQDIIKIAGTGSIPAPAPAPIQTPTPAPAPVSVPAQVPGNTQDVFNQRMGVLDNRLDEITRLIQVGNLSNSQIPEPPTTDDMLASIINPPVKE
ncbi:MAG: hypothetical protein [Bacteriophage sp.]|nr:MAG: hypothetical protein [Bacteriophage sp.]